MSVTSSSSSNGTPPLVSYGLVSGLNTSAIIQAELQPYQQPITNLQNQQSTLNSNVGDYQQINTDLAALETSASALSTASGWQARTATVSDPTVATATASSGTPAGAIQFTVNQLASANSLVSSGQVSSTSQIVTTASDFLLAQGGGPLGFASLGAGSGLSLGSHTISVTQASSAASTSGTIALASQTSGITITSGSNDTINVSVGTTSGGPTTPYTLTLGASPAGGYSGSALLSAVQSAISAAGASGVLQAGFDSGGHLVLSTVAQGSSQTLALTGGTALSTLGLSTTGTITGTDAVVNVDGTANTLSTVSAGSTVTLTGANGSVQATLAGQPAAGQSLISDGSLTATNISTGNQSLADVVANINSAGTGITASSVQTGTNQYVLQLTSSTTGSAADLSVDTSTFSASALGALRTASAGQDAQISVGGAGGYTVSSANNTFTGLLPGLSVTVNQTSTTATTVTVASDTASIASSVSTMVNDANTVLADLQKYAGYNAATKTGGPLMGAAPLTNLTNQIFALVAASSGTSNLGNSISAGISISNGQLSFDKTAFETAYNSNPTQVQNLFTRGGTFSPSPSTGSVSLVYASTTTKPGSYAVNVTQSAAQATAVGATLAGGSVTAAENLTVSMGSGSVNLATSAGETLGSVATSLNTAFASQGMAMSAVVNANRLELISSGYGSKSSFSVTSSNTGSGTLGLTGGSASATYSGTDVQGTINNVAATGTGQFLTAPATDPTLGGLSLQVTATGATSGSPITGTFTYTPGLAQAVANLADSMSNPATGSITQTIKSLQSQSTLLTPQIQFYTNIMNAQQKVLMNQYANLEATLGQLKNQSSSLAAQLSKLP